MLNMKPRHLLMAEEGEGGTGGGAPAPAPAPAAAAPAPAPAAAAPAASPAAAPAAAPAPAASAAPAAAPAPAPAAAPAEPPAAPAPKWPDNWRELMAGELPANASEEEKEEHEKLVKRLKRLNSPGDAAKVLREQDKLIPTLKRAAPPKNATPEQMAQWRAEVGIPESPDKYEIKLPDGLVLGDHEKPLVDEYVKALHGEHATPAQVNAGVAAYLRIRDQEVQRIQEQDVNDSKTVEDELRQEWGGEYRRNVESVNAMLGSLPTDVAEALKNARGPGGKALVNNVGVVTWLAGLARERGFVGATLTPQGGDLGASVSAEIKEIEAKMWNPDGTRGPYYSDPKMQARYQELKAAEGRLKKAA